MALDHIIVNGGRRGVLVELATEDLVRLLDAKPADLCRG
jgi:prolyl-tRNA editing enzyme YbaK/EbsC (Cys-tRNA(Pro) deacylase)